MAVEKNGSKTDVIVKLLLVFFVCLLSFSIGTYVGKKFSDNQHQMAKYESGSAQTQDRDVASVNPASTDMKPSDALTDDEVAKLAEEFVADEKTPESHAKSEGKPTTDKNTESVHEAKASEESASATEAAPTEKAHATSASVEEEVVVPTKHTTQTEPASKAAQQVARGEAPVATEVAAKTTVQRRIPSSLPKEMAASSVGKYTLQVAAYPEESEAKKMATDLKAKGFSAFYVSAKVKDRKTGNDKTWYRVSVGLFTTQKEAESNKAELMSRGKLSEAMVQKIVE